MSEHKEVGLGFTFRPFQSLIFKAMKRFNVIVAHRRFGKCCTASTEVPTPTGIVRIVDLKVGDYVLGTDGKPTRVLGTYEGGVKQIYKVHFNNGQVVETDDQHLWYVEPSYSEVTNPKLRKPWLCGTHKTTEDIMLEGKTVFIPTTITEYGEKELPIDPWLFGYWLGNGSKSEFSLTASYQDDHLFSGYSNKVDYDGGCFRYHFSKRKNILRTLGVLDNKHIPRMYLEASIEQRKQLLRGLMDSDGTVASSGTCRFDNKNKVLIDNFKELVSSLGLIPSDNVYLRGEEKEYYVLFTAKGFMPFTLDRKNSRVRINDKPLRHRIVKVERTNVMEPVYCINVEASNNLFLVTRTFIPTHNTIFALLCIIIRAMMNHRKNPQYAYIAPTYGQAERIAWVYLKDMLKDIPNVEFHEAKLRARIHRPDKGDHITIFLLGAESPDSIRGMYLDGVILDEYAQCSPSIWGEVIRPLLSDRLGWAVFIGTPKGMNNFYELYQRAQRLRVEAPELGWYTFLAKASVTKIVPDSELMAMKSEMSDEEYEQEMEASFTAAMVGSYYGKYINAIQAKGQITMVPYEKQIRVTTFWDLGWDDSTCIWFMQRHGKAFRFIKYIENRNVGLEWYANELQKLGYIYEEHWLPHDGAVKELGTGVSRVETLRDFGLQNIRVAPKLGVEEGINAVRMVLDQCWFDEIQCQRGLDCLKNYERKWDSKANIFSGSPLHNWASHGADGFRTFGVVNRRIANRSNYAEMMKLQSQVTEEKWW